MALPILVAPKYELVLPSSGKTYSYRPFLVKEEKVLLMAMEGNDEKEMVGAIKQIISSCVENIDVNILPTFDLEYVFLKLRAKSVNDKVTFNVKHANNINSKGEDCDGKRAVTIDLNKVEVVKTPGHSNKIQLNDQVGLIMKYPNIEISETAKNTDSDTENVFDMIKKCIESVFDTERTYSPSDYTPKEMDTFIDSLTNQQLEDIQKFFETMPKLKYEMKWKCEKCGCEEVVLLEGLNNFFT